MLWERVVVVIKLYFNLNQIVDKKVVDILDCLFPSIVQEAAVVEGLGQELRDDRQSHSHTVQPGMTNMTEENRDKSEDCLVLELEDDRRQFQN